VLPYWVVQFAGGNYPITTPGGDRKSLVIGIALTAILMSVILNTATGARSIGRARPAH
jgi:aquaporin Z